MAKKRKKNRYGPVNTPVLPKPSLGPNREIVCTGCRLKFRNGWSWRCHLWHRTGKTDCHRDRSTLIAIGFAEDDTGVWSHK